jgi:hypothetical protein
MFVETTPIYRWKIETETEDSQTNTPICMALPYSTN